MRIQTKIIVLLSLVVVVFTGGLVFLERWYGKGMESIFLAEKNERSRSFDRLLEIEEQHIKTLAFDYTYWDEMVNFAKTGDNRVWASEMLDTSLESYRADMIWVYRTDGSLVYSVMRSKDGLIRSTEIPLSKEAFGKLLGKERFCHFFLNTPRGLMEIRGATIHPSNDVERKMPPRGYLFVGRLWNEGYLKELGHITQSTVSITPVGEAKTAEEGFEKGIITLSRALNGWDGKPIAQVNVRVSYPYIKEPHSSLHYSILLYAFFSLVFLSLLFVLLMRWVGIPIGAISRSLKAEDPAIIKDLQNDKTEFGQLARLINRFFEQRSELVREIAERKRAEEALRRSETRFRRLLESAPEAMVIVNGDGKIVLVNAKAEEIFGYTRDELIGQPVEILVPERFRSRHAEYRKSYIAKPQSRPIVAGRELWALRKDGTEFPAEIGLSPLNTEGEILISSMIRDITERKNIEEAQKNRELLLEKQRKALLELTKSRIMRDGDLKTAFERITETSSRTLGVERVGIWLYEDDFSKIRCLDLYEQGHDRHSSGLEIAVSSAPSYFKAMEERNSIMAHDAQSDSATREFVDDYLRPWGITSMLDVPIRLGGRIIGVLCHEHVGPVRQWSMEEQGFALAIADIVSLAMEHRERKRVEEALRRSQEKLQFLISSTPAVIYNREITGNYNYTFISPNVTDQLGYASQEFTEDSGFWARHIHTDDAPRVFMELPRLFERGHLTLEYRFLHKNGGYIWVRDELELTHDREGNQLIVGYWIDITERKHAEEVLLKTNEKLTSSVKELERRNYNTTLLNEMGDLLQTCITDKEAYAVIAEFAQRLFHADSGALCVLDDSQNLVETVAVWGESPHDESMFTPEECWALRRGKVHSVENPHSELLCQHLSRPPAGGYMCVPMMAQGKALGILYLENPKDEQNDASRSGTISEQLKESTRRQLAVAMARNIELALANLKLRETLRNQAIRDSLTGLFNRRYMEETLRRELHRSVRRETQLGIIMLDIDHFKRFNDTFGHAAGDVLLREIGTFLQSRIRKEDVACRYGGEEFMLILPDSSLEDTKRRAEELREGIKHLHIKYEGQSLGTVTLSLGVAVFPNHGETAETVLQTADWALYLAKEGGRDQVVVVGETIEQMAAG